MEKIYYNYKDVIDITGCSQSLAYNIIRKLRESFKEKYPEAITIQGKIPKWYFEEIMKVKRVERND
jgi:predicted DNA-binding transcriptional regulator AlpA